MRTRKRQALPARARSRHRKRRWIVTSTVPAAGGEHHPTSQALPAKENASEEGGAGRRWGSPNKQSGTRHKNNCLSFVSHLFLICFSYDDDDCLLASSRPPPPPASSGARALGRHGCGGLARAPRAPGGGILGRAPQGDVAHHPQQPRLHTSKSIWRGTGPRCV